MNIYVRSSLSGAVGYLFIQFLYCIFNNKPGTSIIAKTSDAFIGCILLGPIIWIPLLIYPGVLLGAIFISIRLKGSTVSSSLISSSIILYGIGLIFAQHVLELFKRDTDPWKLFLIAAISCIAGFLFVKLQRWTGNGRKIS